MFTKKANPARKKSSRNFGSQAAIHGVFYVWEFNSDTQEYKCFSKAEEGAAKIKGANIKGRDVWYGIMKVYKETGNWLNDGQELTSYLEAEKESERELRRDFVLRKKRYGEVFPAAMLVVKMMRNGTGTPPSGLMNRRSSTRTRSNGTMMMRDGGAISDFPIML